MTEARVPEPDPATPTIRVRGEAELEVEPEIARVTVRLQSLDADRRAALDRLVERNRACLDLIESYGAAVERVETGGLHIAPVPHEGRREGKVRHYQGTVWIKMVLADFSVLGELVTRLGDLERATVTSPVWDLRRDSETHRRVAGIAARQAVARARDYAEVLGCRLTGLIELADLPDYGRDAVMPSALMASHEPAGAPPPLDLEPESRIVRAAVEARFSATPPDLR